jgi:hypothetical protein
MMLVDGWSLVQERSVKLACFGSVILFTLAFPHSNRFLAKTSPALDADSADLRLPFPNPGQDWLACPLRHVKAVVDLCDF